MAISMSQLADEINKQLKHYSKAINEEAQKEAKKIAQDGAKELKATSPKDSGDYAESWTVKKVKENYVIHNKDHYQLTHLLEKPHLQRDGSKSTPKPHIAKVEEKVVEEFLTALERVAQQ